MFTRIGLYPKITLMQTMLCFLMCIQCSEGQENRQQHVQQNSSTNITVKPFTPQPGSGNWPSFRGEFASGVADEQNLPDTWNTQTGSHIQWKTRIPGLAHASPVIWGDKIFVTTAISSKAEASFRQGFVQQLARHLKLDPAQVVKTYMRRMRETLAARGQS